MTKSKLVKVLAVVAASSAVGIGLGRTFHAKAQPPRAEIKKSDAPPGVYNRKFGATAQKDAPPGIVHVVGHYEGVASEVIPGVPDRVHFGVFATVKTYDGGILIDREPIGSAVHVAGQGITQEFHFQTQLLPGQYYVELFAIDPQRTQTELDGSTHPYRMGYASAHAVVK
jgi:hypothetical protein